MSSDPPPDVAVGDDNGEGASHLVILVPGIRDVAPWIETAKQELKGLGYVVEGAQNNLFGLVGFLWPFSAARSWAMKKVEGDIRTALASHPSATKVSIVAHSFGSYLVANILDESVDLFRGAQKLENLILCGSVLKDRFNFARVSQRLGGRYINEVGTKDHWPAVAEALSFIFGSAGTYGFKKAPIFDRYHKGGRHGDFFKPGFLKKWWLPVLNGASPAPGDAEPTAPGWVRLLTEVRHYLAVAVVVTLLLALEFSRLALYFPPDPIRIDTGTNNPPNSLRAEVRLLANKVGEQCPLPDWLCWLAPLQPFVLAREYRGMLSYDDDLERIETCRPFEYPAEGRRTNDPYEVLSALEAAFPQCMSVDERQAHPRITWRPDRENLVAYTNSRGDQALLCGCSSDEIEAIVSTAE